MPSHRLVRFSRWAAYALVCAVVSTLIGSVVLPIASPGESRGSTAGGSHTTSAGRDPLSLRLRISAVSVTGGGRVAVRGTATCTRASTVTLGGELSLGRPASQTVVDVTSPTFVPCSTTPARWRALGRSPSPGVLPDRVTAVVRGVTCDDDLCDMASTSRRLSPGRR